MQRSKSAKKVFLFAGLMACTVFAPNKAWSWEGDSQLPPFPNQPGDTQTSGQPPLELRPPVSSGTNSGSANTGSTNTSAPASGLKLNSDALPAEKPEAQPASKPVPQAVAPSTPLNPVAERAIKKAKVRRDLLTAYRLAKDPWLDKMVMADPSLVEKICAFPGPARLVAKHRRIAQIAEADHYLCRRLTQWRGATLALTKNPNADKVIYYDPEGIYRAINRNPRYARFLARLNMFNQMVVQDPDLGRFVGDRL
jgi:hypothetical protein